MKILNVFTVEEFKVVEVFCAFPVMPDLVLFATLTFFMVFLFHFHR